MQNLPLENLIHRRTEQLSSELNTEINYLILIKKNEQYIFLHDDENRANALRTLGRWASNTELSFTWYDAAGLSQKIRQEAEETNSPFTNRIKHYLE